MLIALSSFGKSELEILAWVFHSGCVRNVSGAAFFCSVSVLLILLPFTISGITKQNLHSDVLDLRSIFYLLGLAMAENINVFKIVLRS